MPSIMAWLVRIAFCFLALLGVAMIAAAIIDNLFHLGWNIGWRVVPGSIFLVVIVTLLLTVAEKLNRIPPPRFFWWRR